MPYRDPSKKRAAQREAQARRRGATSTPRHTLPELQDLKLETARDVVEALGEEWNRVRRDETLGTAERARVVGYLGTVLLRAFEQGDLEARLAEIEARLAAPAPGLRRVL